MPRKIFGFVLRYLYSLLSCIFLFTIGFVWGKNRVLLYRIAAHFGPFELRPDKPKPIIPKISLSQIVPRNHDINIVEPMEVDGNVSPLELIAIDQLVKHHNPSMIFEIGTFDGRTTFNLAANSRAETKVLTLDLPKEVLNDVKLPISADDALYINKQASGTRYKGTQYENKIIQLYGDSANFDFSPFVNKMDFVFVDGSHSYEYVLNDSQHALKLLKNGLGVILWHDYDSWDGVTNGLNRLSTETDDFKGLRHIEGTSLVCFIKEGE